MPFDGISYDPSVKNTSETKIINSLIENTLEKIIHDRNLGLESFYDGPVAALRSVATSSFISDELSDRAIERLNNTSSQLAHMPIDALFNFSCVSFSQFLNVMKYAAAKS